MGSSRTREVAAYSERFGALALAWVGDELEPHGEAIERALAAVEADIRQAWSTLPSHLAGFWAELVRCIPRDVEAPDLASAIDRVQGSDLYLAYTCRQGRPAAVARFERTVMDGLGSVLRRFDPSDEFIDEIKQRVRTKLLVANENGPAKLALYTGQGYLHTWVRVIAIREALSSLRHDSRRPVASDDELVAIESDSTGPDLLAIREQYREHFQDAFSKALADLEPAARNLLRLHYVHGLTVDELGRVLGVHRSSAARRVAKVRSALVARTRARMREALSMDNEEFERLMAVVLSRIDLSIERVFA